MPCSFLSASAVVWSGATGVVVAAVVVVLVVGTVVVSSSFLCPGFLHDNMGQSGRVVSSSGKPRSGSEVVVSAGRNVQDLL